MPNSYLLEDVSVEEYYISPHTGTHDRAGAMQMTATGTRSNITAVAILARHIVVPSGLNVFIEIWEGGAPDTGVLVATSANVSDNTLPRTNPPGRYTVFPFSPSFGITNGTQYWIVYKSSDGTYPNFFGTNVSGYAGGGLWTVSGEVWTAGAQSIDLAFMFLTPITDRYLIEDGSLLLMEDVAVASRKMGLLGVG